MEHIFCIKCYVCLYEDERQYIQSTGESHLVSIPKDQIHAGHKRKEAVSADRVSPQPFAEVLLRIKGLSPK